MTNKQKERVLAKLEKILEELTEGLAAKSFLVHCIRSARIELMALNETDDDTDAVTMAKAVAAIEKQIQEEPKEVKKMKLEEAIRRCEEVAEYYKKHLGADYDKED